MTAITATPTSLGLSPEALTAAIRLEHEAASRAAQSALHGKIDRACELFGIAYQTAKQAAWVAGAFERSSRLDHLSFGHHDAVCGNQQAGELLEWAAESGATVKQLRERVREIKAADAPPLPEGVYRVIYADPPWEYGDKRTNDEQSGSAESAAGASA